MSAYFIWSYQSPTSKPSIVDLFITNGTVTGGKVLKWATIPIRSMYFSEYVGEDEWRDNWQLVWKCRIELKGESPVQFNTHELFVETDATDDKWRDEPEDDESVACYVIADFATDKELKEALDAVEATDFSEMQEEYGVGEPEFNRCKIMDSFIQLQINLGEFPIEFYEDDTQYALHIIKICEEAGGIVNHLEHDEEDSE